MDDRVRTSGYKKPQCKKFLTTDEVLAALFDSDNDSDGSEISFDSETTWSEEFLDGVPTLVDETKLEEPCFQDTLLDIDVSCLFCLLRSIFLLPKQICVLPTTVLSALIDFYSSQEEEIDYSTNDDDETNDNNDVDNSIPDNAVHDDPQDEEFGPDDESSDGESDNIGYSNKSYKCTQ